MGSGKHRWKISIYRKTPVTFSQPEPKNVSDVAKPPAEFVCPISGSLMGDPVIVSTGQTFERAYVTACTTIGYTPTLNDGSTPDFSVIIPNLALKASILNWARAQPTDPPDPVRLSDALKLVTSAAMMTNSSTSSGELVRRLKEVGPAALVHADSELTRGVGGLDSPGESSGSFRRTPLVLATRPSCYSSGSSSSEFEMGESGTCEEEVFVGRMRSPHVFEQEEGVVALRKITRSSVESRLSLCIPRLLSALRSLITSKYTDIQVNSVAALVNLSLEKINKVKIVRAGFVPPLVDVLRGRFPEAQEHACGSLFSLALDDENKTAIGVLGALQPLIHMMLRSESERAKHDAALALYHLSLVQSNRSKLVKLGSVQLFLNMVKSGQMPGRALLILCNLGASSEGRAAMLDAGAVAFFVELLKGEFDSESTRESCVAAICSLSHGGGLRFRGLAKAAGAMEVLKEVVEKSGRERARDKARRVLEMLKAREEEEEEEVDWEKVLEFGFLSKTLTPQAVQTCRNSK
ncbi:hypothetical protein KSS87_003954 [Heliosperma pusillum]|nr:hypothetical protein KSS87_003954 [Heliosperma pusillum]